MNAPLQHALERAWYGELRWLSRALIPLAGLYCAVVALRHLAYRYRWRTAHPLAAPVIVVGNLTVGGTGKTPLVIALVEQLRRDGYRPGVISRGYGGRARHAPQTVMAQSDPRQVGDEPLLIAQRSGAPVVVCADRVAAGRQLLRDHAVDRIIADDGLQHRRLARQVEIVVIDGQRRFGNGHCLPAGPLREPTARLRSVDLRVANGMSYPGEYAMGLRPGLLTSLCDPARREPLDAWRGRAVHAVAGIGHPERFFSMLEESGLIVIRHPLPDHHPLSAADLDFADAAPIVMTEKDAVKCRALATERHWSLPIEAQLPARFWADLRARIER